MLTPIQKYYRDKLDDFWSAIHPSLALEDRANNRIRFMDGMHDRVPHDTPDTVDYIECMEALVYYIFPFMFFERSGKWECLVPAMRHAKAQYEEEKWRKRLTKQDMI